jgi:hypothetical protein
METAKVDIRKLQLLNDRIAQCFDALNQVRLSVHGLSHTSSGITGASYLQQPGVVPQTQNYPFSQPQAFMPQIPQPFGPQIGVPQIGVPQGGYIPQQGAFGASPWGGLQHTSPELDYMKPVWSDPVLASRIAQTFPFAPLALPPVVSLY